MNGERSNPLHILFACLLFVLAGLHLCPTYGSASDSAPLPEGKGDLSGTWYALYDSGGWGSEKNMVTVVRKGDTFIGKYDGSVNSYLDMVGKGEEKIKWRISSDEIHDVRIMDSAPVTRTTAWEPCDITVTKGGNGLVFKRTLQHKGATIVRTLTLDRDPL